MRKRAHNFIDLIGQKFGRLTVVSLIEVDCGIKWFCVCDCGHNATTSAAKLKSGHTKSCGCILSEKTSARNTTHGLYRHPLRGVHNTMIQRCTNPNTNMYYRYGERGITVCKQWFKFLDFYNWAISNGYKQGLTIDRRDNDGNYCPDNCQWIPLADNIAKNAKLSKDDKENILNLYLSTSIPVNKIAKEFDIDESRIYQLLKEKNITKRRYNLCIKNI